MKSTYFFLLTTLTLVAEEVHKPSYVADLLGSLIPIIIFFGIWILLAKRMAKNSGVQEAASSNLELAESNLKVAEQLKRIADILDKKEQ